MGDSIWVHIIDDAKMPVEESFITLRLLIIQSGNAQYEIAVSKDMRVCYFKLIKDIINKKIIERLQFSVNINCKNSMINVAREYTTTDKENGIGWYTEEEWNFWNISSEICSEIYKLMNSLRVKLLFASKQDKQLLTLAKELERHLELLVQILELESEDVREVNYCKSKSKFLVSTTLQH